MPLPELETERALERLQLNHPHFVIPALNQVQRKLRRGCGQLLDPLVKPEDDNRGRLYSVGGSGATI
jgi:hypothetical protein